MSYKILIVDDSKLARMAVSKMLGALCPDWERVEGVNADEAVRLIATAAPDVALLDVNMPGRDGIDLAAELRRTKPGMPVGIVSANKQQEIMSRAHAIGATFLPKPLTEEALRAFLKAAAQVLEKTGS